MPRRSLNGNLIYNGNFEIAPPFTAATATATAWVDGTSAGSTAITAYGWAIPSGAVSSTANVQFDTSVSHSGTTSLKLSTGDATGAITVTNYRTVTANQLFYLDPSTSYTLTVWIKTNNVATNGTFIELRQYSSALATLVTTTSTKLSGTNDWTQLTITVTTNASAAFGSLLIRNNVAGNISQAWFDDIILAKTAIVTRAIVS